MCFPNPNTGGNGADGSPGCPGSPDVATWIDSPVETSRSTADTAESVCRVPLSWRNRKGQALRETTVKSARTSARDRQCKLGVPTIHHCCHVAQRLAVTVGAGSGSWGKPREHHLPWYFRPSSSQEMSLKDRPLVGRLNGGRAGAIQEALDSNLPRWPAPYLDKNGRVAFLVPAAIPREHGSTKPLASTRR